MSAARRSGVAITCRCGLAFELLCFTARTSSSGRLVSLLIQYTGFPLDG